MSADALIREGQVLTGPLFSEPMRVETIRANGADSVEAGLVGQRTEQFRRVTLTSDDVANLTITDSSLSYDGDGRLLRLGLQAYTLGIAYEFEPLLRTVHLAGRPAAAPAGGGLRASPEAPQHAVPARR